MPERVDIRPVGAERLRDVLSERQLRTFEKRAREARKLLEGRTVWNAEATWKARPVVASRIGGIQDQIVDGQCGVLLDYPRDLAAFGGAVAGLLADRERAERMGDAARERVRGDFLSSRSLLDHLRVIRAVL